MFDMKHSILFVDDEQNVLNGLRRSLRGMRKEWDMTFLDNGEKALQLLHTHPFDVVVSDMRMPGMDGAQLLNEVRRLQPQAVRIILSGYSTTEAVLKTVGPAHQYIAKPCDADTIVCAVNRTMHLRRFLQNDNIVELITGIEGLSSPPRNFIGLVNLLESPQSSLADIADCISEDLAMTTQTLKLVNSAYFSLPERVDNLGHAVSLLGTETIMELALVVGFFKSFSGTPEVAEKLEILSHRSLNIGRIARVIAIEGNLSASEVTRASFAGVLTHVGTLVLLSNWPERSSQISELIKLGDMNLINAERQVYGAAHPEVGAYLLGLWGFSDSITEVVAYHHTPGDLPDQDYPNILTCVYVAQRLLKFVDILEDPDADQLIIEDPAFEYLREKGLAEKFPNWIRAVRKLKVESRSEIGNKEKNEADESQL
jgi:HD-like signal output (HDOD) protein